MAPIFMLNCCFMLDQNTIRSYARNIAFPVVLFVKNSWKPLQNGQNMKTANASLNRQRGRYNSLASHGQSHVRTTIFFSTTTLPSTDWLRALPWTSRRIVSWIVTLYVDVASKSKIKCLSPCSKSLNAMSSEKSPVSMWVCRVQNECWHTFCVLGP